MKRTLGHSAIVCNQNRTHEQDFTRTEQGIDAAIYTQLPVPHGTCTGYNTGCRCTPCRRANTARKRRERDERTARLPLVHGRPVIPDEHAHGNPSTYRNRGCRCDSCTAAQAAYFREFRQSTQAAS